MLFRFFLLILFIKNSTSATNDELKDELRLVRQDIGVLKVENKNQSDQITFLKAMVESQNKIIDAKIVEELNKKMKDCAMTGDDSLSPAEQKQLFRTIPSVHPDANTKNCRLLATVVYDAVFKPKSLPENGTTSLGTRFYGQPTSCSDLSQLGYTLNGFYVVKSNNESTNSSEIKLDNVFCAFKQPEGVFNSSLVEKRIISRREAAKSGIKKIFHATRKTDWVPNAGLSFIPFENILMYSGEAHHEKAELSTEITDMFIAPQSGVYLLIFRGNVTFPNENEKREFEIGFMSNFVDPGPGKMKKGHVIGVHTVHRPAKFASIEFDRMTKVNRGDKIQLRAVFTEIDAKFSGTSISFTLFLLPE